MNRRDFLGLLGVGAVSCLPDWLCATGKNNDRPNIVLIVADDMAYTDLGTAGHPLLKTPNLDRLAHRGVRFSHAFSPNPICTPSRAAILTGQDCWTNGCYFFGMPIKKTSPQLARLLSRTGYETFYTGKWHNDGLPSQRGFTSGQYIGRGGPGPDGHAKPIVADFGGGNKRQIERFDSELFTDAAVQFLDRHRAGDKPFMMFVSYMTPHDPWTPPGKYAEMYPPQEIPMPPNFMPRPMDGRRPFEYYTDWHGNNLRDEKLMSPFPRTPAGVRDVRSRYYGTVTKDDHEIGRLLDKLDEKQLTENTLVIFIADHGISLGAHGISGKQTMYEEGIRLPMIMSYPQLKRSGPVNDNLVSLMDILPTVCHAAGISIPDSVEGESLLDLYQSRGNWSRDCIFAAFVSPKYHRLNVRCVRTKRYKLIHHLTTDEVELYDLQNDPFEQHNLAGKKQYDKLRKQLAAQLDTWRSQMEKNNKT